MWLVDYVVQVSRFAAEVPKISILHSSLPVLLPHRPKKSFRTSRSSAFPIHKPYLAAKLQLWEGET
jgi:hypothetical protein